MTGIFDLDYENLLLPYPMNSAVCAILAFSIVLFSTSATHVNAPETMSHQRMHSNPIQSTTLKSFLPSTWPNDSSHPVTVTTLPIQSES